MGIDLLHESHRPSNNSLTLRSLIQRLVKFLPVRFDRSLSVCLKSDTCQPVSCSDSMEMGSLAHCSASFLTALMLSATSFNFAIVPLASLMTSSSPAVVAVLAKIVSIFFVTAATAASIHATALSSKALTCLAQACAKASLPFCRATFTQQSFALGGV